MKLVLFLAILIAGFAARYRRRRDTEVDGGWREPYDDEGLFV